MRRHDAFAIMQEEVVQQMRLDRIKRRKTKKVGSPNSVGDVTDMDAVEVKASAVIAPDYVVHEGG